MSLHLHLTLKLASNGLRYPLVGGTSQRCFDGTNLKPRKLPENAQTPTRRVHAVLGVVELEDSLAKKDDTAKLTNIFTYNFDFGNNQKTDLPKRQIIKKLDQPKQTCLKQLLTK